MSDILCVLILLLVLCATLNAETDSWKFQPERIFRILKPANDNEIKSPSKLLPFSLIETLKETPPIDTAQLQNQLGASFDHEYMSVSEPSAVHLQSNFLNGRPKGHRPSYLKLLTRAHIQDGTTIKLKVDDRTRRKVQNYVWAITMCPVQHTWKNLGTRFWPQWIKEGKCPKKSCSIPPGMGCKATESTYKTILKWHCADKKTSKNCRWIPIEIPLVTKCSCSC